MKNEYVCECGKIFYKPNSFNGHKASCKIHNLIKYGNLDVLECHHRTFSEKGRETQQKNNVDKKEEKDKLWVSEKHNCEHCGKVMTEKFGSGRFCSRQCANSREFSDESKEKKKNAATGKIAYYNIDTHKRIYLNPEDDVPNGFVLWEQLNGESIDKIEKLKKSKEKKLEYLKNKKSAYEEWMLKLNEHNKNIIEEYEDKLRKIANDRVYQQPQNQFIFAKYFSVSQKHPRSLEGHVFVHILMAEDLLGRQLTQEEIVHHKNMDKLDNRFDNIYIFDTQNSHARFHMTKKYFLEINDNLSLSCKKIDFDYNKYIINNSL